MVENDPVAFDESQIEWRQFRALERVYYHILGVDVENETVDWLMKFEPNRTCVMHRHTGPTKTFVPSGEHHLYEPDAKGGFTHTARKAGVWAESRGDNVHYEGGGELGGVIYLSMTGKDGTIYNILTDELELERAISVNEFKRGLDKRLVAERSD